MKEKFKNKKIFHFIYPIIFIFISVNCSNKIKPTEKFSLNFPLGLDSLIAQIPKDNPLTLKKIKLGRKLFFDKRLSVDEQIACADCHNPLLGFADGRSFAKGFEEMEGTRSAPTIINRLFSKKQFWDGRAASLEEQVIGPILNPIEMNNTKENVIKVLSKDVSLKNDFKEVFGSDITIIGIQKAIASFERTILSGNSPFDRFITGDSTAISLSAIKGFQLFKSERVNCVACHKGQNFTDELYHNTGIGTDKKDYDFGRFIVTKNDSDIARFKTSTLRDIARTAPFMHDGSLRTLKEVIEFYDKGGIKNSNLSDKMKPLKLTEEEEDNLIEFLRSLSGMNPLAADKIQTMSSN